MIYTTLPPHIRGNLFKLNVIKFSKWFSVIMPIIVPFYQDNGLSITSIMTLKSVYAITIIALELPSGYFSDVLGRKNMLVTGSFLGAAGYFVYSLTHSYAGFLVAEIALGAGQSFISGADSAMLFDTLASSQRQKQYARFEGINASVGNFSEAFAGIAGGGLALISLRLPFYVQAVIATSAIPASLALVEPNIPRPKRTHDRMKQVTAVLAKIIRYEKDLRFNLLFSSIIGAATLLMAWFAQPLFEKMLMPLALFGVAWTGLNLVTGGSSVLAHRIEARLGELRTLKLIAFCIPLLMILSGIVPNFAIIPVLLVFYFLRGIATPVLKDYVNQRTETEVRATVMSLRDLTIRVFFSLFAPMAGWLTDHYSLGTGLAAMGGFLMIFSLLTLVLFMKYRSKNQHLLTENQESLQNEK